MGAVLPMPHCRILQCVLAVGVGVQGGVAEQVHCCVVVGRLGAHLHEVCLFSAQ